MTNWLDIMPAIPLARGVPVIDKTTKWRGVTAVAAGRLVVKFDQVEGWVDADSTFVDLSDPLGFAYALRYATRHHHDPSVLRNREIGPERWLHDEPCDDERLDLARTLQEVNHAKVKRLEASS